MQKKVNLLKITLMCLWLLVGLNGLGVVLALAQEPEPRPPLPPVNSGSGGDSSGDHHGNGDNDSAPIPGNGRVSGFVYSYSDRAYVGGVNVVISGGGWQAETTTDSNGFYQFGGLGIGRGVLNLRLPPGAFPVVFDWPVQIDDGADLQVDLGYYWQDQSVLPAIASGQISGQNLTLKVKNQTSAALQSSILEIISPVNLELSPAVTVSQGKTEVYSPYQLRFIIGTIEPATSVTVNVPLKKGSGLSPEPEEVHIRAVFTYDQQKTPLLTHINSDQVGSWSAFSEETATATPEPAISALPQPPVSVSPTRVSPLPTTGNYLPSTSSTEVILPILLILGLSLAGWYALTEENSNPY